MPSPFAARFWGGHVVMVVLLAAAVLLGIWQINVYESHRKQAAINRTEDRAVPLATALGHDQAFPADAVGRPVTITGSWLPQDTVLVSGQLDGGRDGYWVVTPVDVTASGSALPVVLGWTADPTDVPAPPTGSVQLSGWLQPSQDDAATDATTLQSAATPAHDVVPELQTAALAQRVGQDLYDGYAVARGGVAGLPQAELLAQPDAGFWTSLRNLLYGVQWWVFGGFAVLMWWRWLADARADEVDPQPGPEPDREPDRGPEPSHVEPDDTPVSTVKA